MSTAREETIYDHGFAPAVDMPKVNTSETGSESAGPVRRHVKRRWTTLTCSHILALADEYHARNGTWPTKNSGKISGTRYDTWSGFDQCLMKGRRGLPGGSSLVKLFIEDGRLPPVIVKPNRDIDTILDWADSYHAHNQTWPNSGSGLVAESPDDTWEKVDRALRDGQRGLPCGGSLSRLLNEKRGVSTILSRGPLNPEKILPWADAHFDRTGQWPTRNSGEVFDAPGEMWNNIDSALMQGHRSLPAGGSLALLLADCRGRLHLRLKPDLDLMNINVWVLNHYTRTGRLPRVQDGPIPEAPDESWSIIDCAFRYGRRGLAASGFNTLKEFLDARFTRADFGQRVLLKPRLYISIILKWADSHFSRTGKWPNTKSGSIPEAPGETWLKVNHEMCRGYRGLGTPTTLARLLAEQRGLPPPRRGPLTFEQILKWADEHHARTGYWPNRNDTGEIPGAPYETWRKISWSLHQGLRGLPVGSSLSLLLLTYRGRPHCKMMPPHDLDTIESWVRSYLYRYERWPGFSRGGVVDEAPEERWRNIDAAFKSGSRGLKGCGFRSLDDFMIRRMGKPLSKQRGHWKCERTAGISE